MMWIIQRPRALVMLLAVAFVVSACGKQQVRTDGAAAPPTKVPETVATSIPKPEPKKPEPPPTSSAVEPVPTPRQEPPPARRPMTSLRSVHFDFDKSLIRPDARPVLAANAEHLRENPTVRIRVAGHCDERGTAEYNLALGERRAVAAAHYLTDLGISASRVTTLSYGKEVPLDPRSNEEAWALNRRAEFVELGR